MSMVFQIVKIHCRYSQMHEIAGYFTKISTNGRVSTRGIIHTICTNQRDRVVTLTTSHNILVGLKHDSIKNTIILTVYFSWVELFTSFEPGSLTGNKLSS